MLLNKSCVFTSHNQFCLSCKVAAAALSFLRIISPLLLSISPKVEYFWPTFLDDECSSPSFLCDAMKRRQTTITESWLLVVLRKVAAVASSLLFFLPVNFGPLMYFVEDGISEFPSTPHRRATQLMEPFLLAPKGDLCSPNHSPWCQPSEQRGDFGLWTKKPAWLWNQATSAIISLMKSSFNMMMRDLFSLHMALLYRGKPN